MAEDTAAQVSAPLEQQPAKADAPAALTAPETAAPKPAADPVGTASATDAPAEEKTATAVGATSAPPLAKKPSVQEDVEMKDAAQPADIPDAEPETAATEASDAIGDVAPVTPVADKSTARRKSTGASESKNKKLKKKASKARIVHLDAKPGDHYLVRLKGHPDWPAIICDEAMLPQSLLKRRPVTAARADGTYRDDFADGAKRAGERTFPVMYLHTNEFGWVPNTNLMELDPETVLQSQPEKARKPLQEAYQLASENHDLDYYKNLLQQYQDDLIEQEKAAEAEAEAEAQAQAQASTKKTKKTKAKGGEEVEMADVAVEDEEDGVTPAKEKKTKKRKAEEETSTPQRSDSVKKPKIKLTNNSTPKTANGTKPTPKSVKAGSDAKAAKPKAKKASKEADDNKAEKEAVVMKEPELSPEEKHARKEKEVLFLRHKLQKGLLTRDQEPKEDEMKLMSDYITKLEGFPDLEVSIIRATKINKVLKAILKLETIPKEEEYHFKTRSEVLLNKWNKLLAVDGPSALAASTEAADGVNGTSHEEKAPTEETKPANGIQDTAAAKQTKDVTQEKPEVLVVSAKSEAPAAPAQEKFPAEEAQKPTEAVEASA